LSKPDFSRYVFGNKGDKLTYDKMSKYVNGNATHFNKTLTFAEYVFENATQKRQFDKIGILT